MDSQRVTLTAFAILAMFFMHLPLNTFQFPYFQVNGLWAYTSNYDSSGRITDTCRGDSGGPLFAQRNGQVELVGILKVMKSHNPIRNDSNISLPMWWWLGVQGEGFDCRTNKINGDGEWSNVAAQKQWIENRLIPGAGKGGQRTYHKNQIQNAEKLFILFSLKFECIRL